MMLYQKLVINVGARAMTIFLKIDTVTLTLSQDPDIRTCSRYYHTQHLCEVILISINKYMHLSDDKSWTYLRRLCTYTLKNGTYPISARHLVLLWNKKKKKKKGNFRAVMSLPFKIFQE